MFVLRTYNALTKVTSILLLYILPALVASSNTGVPSVYAADLDVGSAGTLVGLAGKGFLPNTTCRFGSSEAKVFDYTGSNRIYCMAPQHNKTGKVYVTCSNDGAVWSKPNEYATFFYS